MTSQGGFAPISMLLSAYTAIDGEPYVENSITGQQTPLSKLTDVGWHDHLRSGGVPDTEHYRFGSRPTIERYVIAKMGLITVEIVLAILFLAIAATSYGLAVQEAITHQVPSLWGSTVTLTALIAVGAGLVGISLVLYAIFGWMFSRVGEQQLDDLLASFLAYLVMFGIALGLSVTWLTNGDVSDDGHRGFLLRRTLYVFLSVQGLVTLNMLSRSICRLLSVERPEVVCQSWKAAYHPSSVRLSSSGVAGRVVRWFDKPNGWRIVVVTIMLAFTATVVALSAWLLSEVVALDTVPDFVLTYNVYGIVMGVMLIIMFGVWIVWSVSAIARLDPIFKTHFDAYYIGTTFLPLAVIFLLLGYRYNYASIIAVGHVEEYALFLLRQAYWLKITLVQLVAMPYVAAGLGKGVCLMSNLYPLNPARFHCHDRERPPAGSHTGTFTLQLSTGGD